MFFRALIKMKNKKTRQFIRAVAFSFVGLVFMIVGYFVLEPRISGAVDDTDDITVNLDVLATVSINTPSDVNMSPDITGTGSSTGSAIWTVTTNNSSGWKLEVNASTNPAMQSGSNTFANYTETSTGVPETWSIAAAASEFGFGATGSYVETKFGADKYMGFATTTKEQVSHQAASTAGSDTTVIFKAEVGSSKLQPTGSYSATITATATTL